MAITFKVGGGITLIRPSLTGGEEVKHGALGKQVETAAGGPWRGCRGQSM